jgi:hypothetical protein
MTNIGVELVAAGQQLMAKRKNRRLPRVLLAFAPLHRIAMGVAGGTVLSSVLFLVTVVVLLRGGSSPEPNLGLLSQFLFGYKLSFTGSIVGLLWGFAIGFTLGWSFALLRNLTVWAFLAIVRSRAEMEQFGDVLDHL